MGKTLGTVVNAALKTMGEPEITSFTAANILQQRLIEVANNAVRELSDQMDFDWRLQRAIITTAASITTDSSALTNGSTTVTSVDSDGVNANSFTGAAAGMYYRRTGDQTSYLISSVNTGASPDTITLETAYLGSTSTAAGYQIIKDTFSVSTANFGELVVATYGGSLASGVGGTGQPPLVQKTFAELIQIAGGDRHRNTSGRPQIIAEIGADTSDNPQYVLYPFPDDKYLVELWYTIDFSENATFATEMFGADAPVSAYDFVEHKVVAAGLEWDENYQGAAVYEQRAQIAMTNVIKRENRERIDVGFDVETYRRQYGVRYPGSSSTLFDMHIRRT
tara:strand:+ start:4807 stop:5814 length:1008 start_codon:yes stop_codon:yes gene_type:complete